MENHDFLTDKEARHRESRWVYGVFMECAGDEFLLQSQQVIHIQGDFSMHSPLNRRSLIATGAASSLLAAAPWARAQSFPERQLTIVVPAPPGGTADISSRAISDPLSKALGQGVAVDNKGGGNGAVGAQVVINAKPDGHTLLMAYSGFHCMSPHLVKLPYDPLKDLQAVANVYSAPQVMVVRSNLGIKTVQELIAYAKKNPGKLNYGSSGNGSVQHIATELFKQISGTFITHIPYRGSGPTITDLLASQIDLTVTTAPSLMPHIQSGRFTPLVVAGPRRLASLPNVPTGAEAGLKGFEVDAWFALYTHAQAPKAAVDRIAAEVQKIMAVQAFKDRATSLGAEANFIGPREMMAYAQAEYDKWGRVIKSAKITAD
jgi:tripartite-type tricarboxylate transporter receptor subunit TctC